MQTQRIELNSQKPLEHEGYIRIEKASSKETHEISKGLSLGRDSSCSLVLNDPFISLRHCRIERNPDGFLLRDLRSRNGTFLNGAKVLEAQLQDGDRIQLGQTQAHFSFQRESNSLNQVLQSKNSFWSLQLSRLPSISESELPVLLLGDSGTGKELLAEQIHRNSSRRQMPFVSVNCSALSEALVESELFGHKRGSFTGATHDRKGAFEAARGGTLFLDEVGDLPLCLQPKLLRALENNEIRPVGSDKTVRTNVRIVAATHANLKSKVMSGEFRSDLYYRLQGVQLNPPNLKNRMEDFDTLFYQFAKKFRVRFSFDAIEKLKLHPWPGNIRELKNAIARAKALFPDTTIQPEHIDEIIDRIDPLQEFESQSASRSTRSTSLFKDLEKRLILERMNAHNGNQRRVAEELGIPKSTLNDRIKSYQIDPKSFKA